MFLCFNPQKTHKIGQRPTCRKFHKHDYFHGSVVPICHDVSSYRRAHSSFIGLPSFMHCRIYYPTSAIIHKLTKHVILFTGKATNFCCTDMLILQSYFLRIGDSTIDVITSMIQHSLR